MTKKDRVNVVLVDDQPAKLLSLETILEPLDENIVSANSADEALKFLLSNECAVVLVDVCMPKMDGFEFAEMIRVHPRFCKTAIIFISGVYLSDADRLRGYDLGAVDYMPVPIVPDVLRAKVAIFVELFRKNRELERLNAELRDRIAEVNLTNERLRFADRMATIGTLAAGLGHDMGNLLLPVRLRLDALDAMNLNPAASADIKAIREASEYLQSLARSLRLLAMDSEQDQFEQTPLNLQEWWKDTAAMFQSGVPRNVTLAVTIPENVPQLRIGKAALTQMAFNLVQNAGDALRDRAGGRIEFDVAWDPASRMVLISVRDDGPGMTDEAKRRCFEPFFTTKTRGLSTGLGLTLVDALVKRAQGRASVQSESGRGTCITLELPVCEPGSSIARNVSRPVAAVAVKDHLLNAHVRSVLASLEFEIAEGGSAEGESVPDVHVAETDEDFPHRGRVKRVVLCETPPQEPREGTVYVSRTLKTAELRSRLRSVLTGLGVTRRDIA